MTKTSLNQLIGLKVESFQAESGGGVLFIEGGNNITIYSKTVIKFKNWTDTKITDIKVNNNILYIFAGGIYIEILLDINLVESFTAKVFNRTIVGDAQ